ncbi:MAG: PHP domain-containing protein, partial [Polyangiaceae bacterium]|nr:PHP domain-containing protein [Polyangiaceae bacterium]
MDEFVHLHVHSQYSMLDGAIRLKPEAEKPLEERTDLIGLVKRMNMNAVALTDHANMFGTIGFYKSCFAEGIKPIIGCEINVTRNTN